MNILRLDYMLCNDSQPSFGRWYNMRSFSSMCYLWSSRYSGDQTHYLNRPLQAMIPDFAPVEIFLQIFGFYQLDFRDLTAIRVSDEIAVRLD